jgi:hypothetical protein
MHFEVTDSIAPFIRSRDWFLSICAAQFEKKESRLEDMFTLVLGLWICDRVLRDQSVSMEPLLEKLERKLNSEEFRQTFDPFRYDSKLLLLTHELLSLYNCRVDVIESFVNLVASEFAKLGDIPVRLTGEALLLSQLGLVAPPPVPLLRNEYICADSMSLLRLDRSQLVGVCANVAAASHFGAKPLRAHTPVRLVLKELLPSLLFQGLRDYDLELGATILRTMRYAGLINDWAFRLGVVFLIDQQDKQGPFGRLSREAIALADSGIAQEDVTARLCLPVSVSCVWALAEALHPDFTLMSSCAPDHSVMSASPDARASLS